MDRKAMDPRVDQINGYKAMKIDVKRDKEYQKLMSKHRGPLEDKLLEKYVIQLSSLDAKIQVLEAAIEADKPKPPPRVIPVVKKPTYLRHPTNNALRRLATATKPNGPKNMHVRIDRSAPVTAHQAHLDLLENDELDNFLRLRKKPEPVQIAFPATTVRARQISSPEPPPPPPEKPKGPILKSQKLRARFSRTYVEEPAAEKPVPIDRKFGRTVPPRPKKEQPAPASDPAPASIPASIPAPVPSKKRGPQRVPKARDAPRLPRVPRQKPAIVDDLDDIEIAQRSVDSRAAPARQPGAATNPARPARQPAKPVKPAKPVEPVEPAKPVPQDDSSSGDDDMLDVIDDPDHQDDPDDNVDVDDLDIV